MAYFSLVADKPLTWYGTYLALLCVGAVGLRLLALREETAEQLSASLVALAVLPPVTLAVLVASRLPSRPIHTPAALEGPARWALGAVWTAATFATGAFMATLVGYDLDDVKSANSMNQYFYGFFGLVVVSVLLLALISLAFASAWICFRADAATFNRSAVRALTSAAKRDQFPLRVRMWLDEADDHPTPAGLLEAAPITARVVSILRIASERGVLFLAALMLLASLGATYPIVIGWVA